MLLFLLGNPFGPSLFGEVGFIVAELLVVSLEELFPVVFSAACMGISPFCTARFVLFLFGRSAFGVVLFLFAVATIVVSAIVSAFSLGSSLLTFLAGNLDVDFASVPSGTFQ